MTYDNDDLKRCVLEWVLGNWPDGGINSELFDRLMNGETPDDVRLVEAFSDWDIPALLDQFYQFALTVRPRRITDESSATENGLPIKNRNPNNK